MPIQPNKITVANTNKLVELHNVCMKCQEIVTIVQYDDFTLIKDVEKAEIALDKANEEFNAYVKSLTEVVP